ncbi:P-loop containing nucleoside triphosphate hydrolase protein [Naematelia encephala]|uniref:p-loop containing nucleoside triphosphate hydrolase protein n=1 Tax=Naematelia encephala TaxID=71784 RepID=A0A1Y2BBL6_9TREE|nr:P-loop containing nucleoside triphosphate hydrolase protein [Naematelia encephala]
MRRSITTAGQDASRFSPSTGNFGPPLDSYRPVSDLRRSVYPSHIPIPPKTIDQHPDLFLEQTTRPPNPVEPLQPKFRHLFALSSRRDVIFVLLPAILLSAGGSLLQPYLSIVVGDAFQIFANYPLSGMATMEQRETLKNGIVSVCVKLTAAGAIGIALNYLRGAFWFCHGEKVVHNLRQTVYVQVQQKDMEWFDTGMGMRGDEANDNVGVGGLMAKFAKETDDVRMGTAESMGSCVQSLFTFLLCFILALVKSPVLALVTLSTMPIVVLIQIVSQFVLQPLYAKERRAFAEASTNVERATSAIATVKVYNAQQAEAYRFLRATDKARESLRRQALIWGVNLGSSDFVFLATFVLGFWYGAKVVRDGRASSGTVMTVFWACLLGASSLQSAIPQLTTITKGKMSMASLMTIIKDEPGRPVSNPFSPASSPQSASFQPAALNKSTKRFSLKGIRPPRCQGEFNLKQVSFAYASRPNDLVLRDITLFLPAGETTFIVGGSGSGKSTIAQLLLRLYNPSGEITLDDQSFRYLDGNFTREHIAAVQQGCILFDMSVHDNVALGLAGAGVDSKTGLSRRPNDVTRREVIEACKMAMIHEFIDSLPAGYETKLGTSGSSLSGGQRQRLAIARARIRNPTILILDEATSALDATSRVIVFENIRKWRKNQTTIVITHDLSQILPNDFVYVMSSGVIAEQGFRSDLMRKTPLHGSETGVFAAMAAEQAAEPLAPIVKEWYGAETEDLEEILEGDGSVEHFERQRFSTKVRPSSAAYYDLLDEYVNGGSFSAVNDKRESKRLSVSNLMNWSAPDAASRPQSRATLAVPSFVSRPHSHLSQRVPSRISHRLSYDNQNLTKISMDSGTNPHRFLESGRSAAEKDVRIPHLRYSRGLVLGTTGKLEDDIKGDIAIEVPEIEPQRQIMTIFKLIRRFLPTVPSKPLVLLGVLSSIAHGASTPIWSFFLSKLMVIVGQGGAASSLEKDSLIVLAMCLAQGLSFFGQEYFLATGAAIWTCKIRGVAYESVLLQDSSFFNESRNAPARLVQCLVKDADDMGYLMSLIIGQAVVFVIMVGLGILWAMVVDWRLTLIGVALAPVFAAVIVWSNMMVSKAEVGNKAKREAVAGTFYESISNIRGIRAMALDSVFREKFEADAAAALKNGNRSSWIVAIGIGTVIGLPLLAQALLMWTGMLFILKGYLNYAQMLQVYNLVLFSLTFGSQALGFIPTVAKVRVAGSDFHRLFSLEHNTRETTGELRFPITGNVSFERISFAYPGRPDVPIFSDLSFTLSAGECVAIVGPSGSGKSTIAALLQRLYEPTAGTIRMDKYKLAQADTKWLRNHIAVVSQSANLFDATVAENIAYGSDVPLGEIHRAAKAAAIHDFIMTLPNGYDTNLGENASLISGGQAQRLQIARALVRRSNILILDECTSALDVDNARAILDTITRIKDTRTTIFITHSMEAMKRCDRIICLGEGRVAEEGPFEQLIARGGVFSHLMRTGEWE